MARVVCGNCGAEFDLPNHDEVLVKAFNDHTNRIVGTLVPVTTNNKETNMDKTTQRMETLKAAGIDTGNFFNIRMPDGTMAKTKIVNGEMVLIQDDDPVVNKIINSPFVRNHGFDRQWITAQTMKMLEYKKLSKYTHEWYHAGYTTYLDDMYSYNYTVEYLITECNAIAHKLRDGEFEQAEIRKQFWSKEVIIATLEDYINTLRKTLNCKYAYPVKGRHGNEYIKVGTRHYADDKKGNLYVRNIDSTYILPMRGIVEQIKRTDDYSEIVKLLKQFTNKKMFIRLKYKLRKNPMWVDAFKGAGAFYTMMNLVQHSGLKLCKNSNFGKVILERDESIDYLMQRLKDDKGKWFRLLGLLKESIETQGFDFKKVVAESIKERSKKVN